MSLRMQGTIIPLRVGSLVMHGTTPHKLMMEGIKVWEVARTRQVFLETQLFTVPEGVTELTVCLTGGGGGGSVGGLGGGAGQLFTNVPITVTPLENILMTIGEGGLAELDGEDTSMGGYIIGTGGTANVYQGEGAYSIKCGSGAVYDGTYDGTNYGGQSGAFGNGGNGLVDGSSGVGGAGGGSGTTTAGKGGKGGIAITYYT